MGGTFTIIPSAIGSVTGQWETETSPGVYGSYDLSGLLNPINVDPRLLGARGVAAGDNVIRFDFPFGDKIISLDGGVPINYYSLPAGFTITSSILKFKCPSNATDPTHHLTAQFSPLEESTNFANPLANGFNQFVHPNPQPSTISFFSDGCGLRIDNSTPGQQASYYFYGFIITGTYDIVATSYTLKNPTIPVRAGDKIEIDSPDGLLVGLKEITLTSLNSDKTITIPIDSYYIIVFTPLQLIFYIPPDFVDDPGPLEIEIVGQGTQFFGTVTIGVLDILTEDASGIYVLMDGQTNDVLYFREGFTTGITQIMLSSISTDEQYYEDDFYKLLRFPYQILAEDTIEEDEYGTGELSPIAGLQVVVVTHSVEIPSPFIKTGFLP